MRQSTKAQSRSASALLWLACAGLSFSEVRAGTPASWLAAIDSNWTNASQWSTNPIYPNNDNPPGTTYDATIAATGSAYSVSLNTDVSVDSLTLNSPNATLLHTNGALAVNSVNLLAGAYLLEGGWLQAGVITGPGTIRTSRTAQGASTTSTLFGVVLDTDLEIRDTTELDMRGGLTLNGRTITLNNTLGIGGANLIATGQSTNSQTLGGTGTIIFTATRFSNVASTFGTTLTIGPGIWIRADATDGNINAGGVVRNDGTISCSSGRTMHFSGNWSNRSTGLITATNGVLDFAGNYSNSGMIQLNNATLVMAGKLSNTLAGVFNTSARAAGF